MNKVKKWIKIAGIFALGASVALQPVMASDLLSDGAYEDILAVDLTGVPAEEAVPEASGTAGMVIIEEAEAEAVEAAETGEAGMLLDDGGASEDMPDEMLLPDPEDDPEIQETELLEGELQETEQTGTDLLEEEAPFVEDPSPASDFSYEITGEEVTILSYIGQEAVVIIPATIEDLPVKKIAGAAFSHDSAATVKKLVLSEGIETISPGSISGCENLEELFFPASLVVAPEDACQEDGGTVFPTNCPVLRKLNIASGNATMTEISGAVYSADKTMLYYYPTGDPREEFMAAEGLLRICNAAFRGNRSLKKVLLPNTVKRICKGAFAYCNALRSMNDGTAEGHVHTLAAVEEKPAACETDGCVAHYRCDGCGLLFSDAEGTIPVSDVVIPAFGHHYEEQVVKATFESDGKISQVCSQCGAEKDIVPILRPATAALSETEAQYDGNEHRPSVILKDENGADYPESMYTVTWPAAMTEAGRYAITITLQGNAEGSRNLIYTITNPSAQSFRDVQNADKFYYTPVYWAVSIGITTGYKQNGVPTGIFGVEDDCTREQIVTFLWRLMGSPKPKTQAAFTDVKNQYYKDAVSWALENGVTTGISQDKFGVGDPCTRGMCVTFLYRAAGSPDVASGASEFTDVAAGKWYTDAVSWAASKNITTGYKDSAGNPTGKFGVNDTCTRAQIVTFLYRFANLAG